MEKVIGTLGEAFELENEDIRFTFNPTGSTTGIQSVLQERADIGLSSRELTEEEKQEGVESTVLAFDGIALIVNLDNPVSSLTRQQICDIFSGKITSWKEVGGQDQEIVLIGREAGSGTRDGFEQALSLKNSCPYRQELTSSGDIRNAVLSNPSAIGYISLASLKDDVRALAVDGVSPSAETVRSGSYPIARPFLMVTRKDEPLPFAAQMFMDYALSQEASPYIEQAGAISTYAE